MYEFEYELTKSDYVDFNLYRKRLIRRCPKIKIVQLELEHFTLVVRFIICSYFESLVPKALVPLVLQDYFCNQHPAYIVINIGDTYKH